MTELDSSYVGNATNGCDCGAVEGCDCGAVEGTRDANNAEDAILLVSEPTVEKNRLLS